MLRTTRNCYILIVLTLSLTMGIMACQGCATFGTTEGQASVERHQLLFKAATQYATFKVIEKNPGMAPEIARIAGETANLVATGELIALPALEELVRSQIKWDTLTPEEFVLIDALIASVRLELENAEASLSLKLPVGDAIEKEQVDAATRQTLYYASVVLRWIEQAALMKAL